MVTEVTFAVAKRMIERILMESSQQSPSTKITHVWPSRTLIRFRDPESYKSHLLSRTEKHGDCILFTGCIAIRGYAMVRYQGRGRSAHQVLWEMEHGPVPKGMHLDHTCHDPAFCKLGVKCPHRRCVNIGHLKLVTPKENCGVGRSNGPSSIALALKFANALKKSKTHCPKGHEWTKENTRIVLNVDGTVRQRACRACHRIINSAYKKQKRADAKKQRV